MFSLYFFLSVLVSAKGQIPSLGFCPEYFPMADFDMSRFLGKWYEAERYFQFSELASRCVVTDYARGPSGKIYVSNEVTNRLTGIKRVIDGTIEQTGKIGEGQLNVKYSTTPLSTESTLIVLETDYDSFAVVWSCSGFGPLHAESVWLMTRDRIPPGPVLQQAYGVLDKFRISRNFFIKTDQAGCAIAASDINAANGIASISTVAETTGSEQRKRPLMENHRDKVVEKDASQILVGKSGTMQKVQEKNVIEKKLGGGTEVDKPSDVYETGELQENVEEEAIIKKLTSPN
ncbi:unnamed protein product [Phaedon cochleariae]|uniref:Lipocalin/cytosolic fatty-acid binding domain-containing protein n=1 Tax=Phaedon cochleariae TaxID=80249 RepID=A0A9P0DQA6_PHACE|nr:unnamed protein product [Phaedon cochleariae]